MFMVFATFKFTFISFFFVYNRNYRNVSEIFTLSYVSFSKYIINSYNVQSSTQKLDVILVSTCMSIKPYCVCKEDQLLKTIFTPTRLKFAYNPTAHDCQSKIDAFMHKLNLLYTSSEN